MIKDVPAAAMREWVIAMKPKNMTPVIGRDGQLEQLLPDQSLQVHPQGEGSRHPRPANPEGFYCGDFAGFELVGFSGSV